MGISPYMAGLRRKIGTDLVICPGVTVVVRRDDEVLLVRRSDNGEWTPIMGMCDPGEDVAQTAVREAWEEASVHIEIERVLWLQTLPPTVYENGDRVQYFDTAFAARWIGGEAAVGDEESVDVRWFPATQLPAMQPRLRRVVGLAVRPEPVLVGTDERPLAT